MFKLTKDKVEIIKKSI